MQETVDEKRAMGGTDGGQDRIQVEVKTTRVRPRDFQIRQEDAERLGYSRSCGGCSSWFKGRARQPHTEVCRERFRKLLADEARVQYAAQKRREFDENMEDKGRKKLARTQDSNGQGGYAQVGGSSSSSGAAPADNEQGQALSDEVNERLQVEKRGKDHSWEELRGQEKRMRRDDVAMQQADEDADRIASEHGISELRAQSIESEARKSLLVIERWVQEIAEVVESQIDVEEEHDFSAWDDVKGGWLSVKDVQAARNEEVGYMNKRGIWVERSLEECWRKTGKAPISVRWVDTDKGLDGEVDVRSRLVARDFKGKGSGKDKEDSIYASTPPLEGLRMLCSKAASVGRNGNRRKVLLMDARKAHLNPRCEQEVYIELPEEVGAAEGVCGRLEFWMYGMRPAAQAWEECYSRRMEEVTFKRGIGNAVVFYQGDRDVFVLVHGDDFVAVGEDEDIE